MSTAVRGSRSQPRGPRVLGAGLHPAKRLPEPFLQELRREDRVTDDPYVAVSLLFLHQPAHGDVGTSLAAGELCDRELLNRGAHNVDAHGRTEVRMTE